MSKFVDIQIDPGIVRLAARGDTRAHEIIYRTFGTPVYSICLRFTRIPAQAEDLLQETFMEVIRSIRNYRGDAPLGAWIRRIAVTKSLMYLRSAWHSRGQSLDDEWDESAAAQAEGPVESSAPDASMDLDAALASLPAISRTVVWLHDVEGFTHKEIADLMGRTESFSKSQLSRAYQRLRPLLDENARLDMAEHAAYGSCNATN